MTPAEFRGELLDALHNSGTELQFDQLVRTTGVSHDVANVAAHQLFQRYVSRLVDDGDYTAAERQKADRLAEVLKIPAADAIDLAEQVREDRYRSELLEAEADGVITDEEKNTLDGLRVALDLSAVPVPAGRPHTPEPSAVLSMPDANIQPHTQAQLKQRLFRSINTPNGLLQELEVIRAIDNAAEKKKSFWDWVAACALISGVVGLFFAVALIDSYGGIVFPASAALIVASFVAIFIGRRHGHSDFDDRRYTIAQSVLRYLQHDMAPSDLVALDIDFNNYNQKQYRSDGGKDQMMESARTKQYELPWLSIKGRFVDGMRFRLGVTQSVKRKETSKRKYTKVKEGFCEKLSLTFIVRPKLVSHLPIAASILQNARLSGDLSLHSVNTRDNRLTLQATTHKQTRVSGRRTVNNDAAQETGNHHNLLQLFLACYDALGRAREAHSAA